MKERDQDLPALVQKYMGKGRACDLTQLILLVAYWSGLRGILRNLSVGLPLTIAIGILVDYEPRSNLELLCGTNFALTIRLIINPILIAGVSSGENVCGLLVRIAGCNCQKACQ
jgi:hypothetical protein